MAEMTDIRKQLLAGFLGGHKRGKMPSAKGLEGLSLMLRDLARVYTAPGKKEEDLDAGELFDMSNLEERFEEEAQKMLALGLLAQSKPNEDPNWEPAPGRYELTLKGATLALGILKEWKAAGSPEAEAEGGAA